MSWRARPICMDCQRTIHGPGTGVVGPIEAMTNRETDPEGIWLVGVHRCALCHMPASPYNIMRLWKEPDEPDDGLDAWFTERETPAEPMAVFIPKEELYMLDRTDDWRAFDARIVAWLERPIVKASEGK